MFSKVDHKVNHECLNAHNELRQHHGVPDLAYSESLAVESQKWAEQLAQTQKFQHSPESATGKIGENIATSMNRTPGYEYKGQEATQQWYDEIEDYDFNQDAQIQCGHFSQVIWKSTTEAGFGRAKDSAGNFYIVGKYTPAGNMMGKWIANVPAPLDGTAKKLGSLPDRVSPKSQGGAGQPKMAAAGTLQPVIGPKNRGDTLIGTSKKTTICNGEKIAVICEKYQTPNGDVYTVEGEDKGGASLFMDKTKFNADDAPVTRNVARTVYAAPVANDEQITRNVSRTVYAEPPAKKENRDSLKPKYHEDYDGIEESFHKEVKPTKKIELAGFQDIPKEKPPKADYDQAIQELAEACYTPAQHQIYPAEHKVTENDGVNEIMLTKHIKGKDLNDNPLLNRTDKEETELEEFREELLLSHNKYRQHHKAKPLRLNHELSEIAQKWAEELLHKNLFQHSMSRYNKEPLGENIASRWTSKPNVELKGEQVVDQWYSQNSKYEYGRDPVHMEAGHFTQVVWKDTQEIGVGMCSDRAGKHVIVCNYFPAGNKIGKFAENVSK